MALNTNPSKIEAAEAAFQSAYDEYKGKRVPTISLAMLEIIGKPIEDSYCVDASCIGYPGPMEYKCVQTTTQQEIFHQGSFENGSNNIGEFLAVVHVTIAALCVPVIAALICTT